MYPFPFFPFPLNISPPTRSRHISCLTLGGNPGPISCSNRLNQNYTLAENFFFRSQRLVEFGRTSCFCRGLWEKPKLELSNYHRKVNFASFLVADCGLAGQAVIFLTGLSEVFISILATSVRYQGFTLLSSPVQAWHLPPCWKTRPPSRWRWPPSWASSGGRTRQGQLI